MPDYDDTNKGVLFFEQDKKSDKHPDLTGKLNVEGKEYRVAAWVKQGRNGEFYTLAISEPREQSEGTGYQQAKAKSDEIKAKQVDDVAEVGDEPISLDDIPF